MKINTFITMLLWFLYIATIIICGFPDFDKDPTPKGLISATLIILGIIYVVIKGILFVLYIKQEYGEEELF